MSAFKWLYLVTLNLCVAKHVTQKCVEGFTLSTDRNPFTEERSYINAHHSSLLMTGKY